MFIVGQRTPANRCASRSKLVRQLGEACYAEHLGEGAHEPVVPGQGWCGTLGGVTVMARVEHVGSLLRPGFLRDARDAYVRGELAPAGLKAAEDLAVREVVVMQARLGQARCVVDAERLALSPQCGFATSVGGNAITPEAQRAKLALLVRAARDFLPASTGT